MTSTCIPLHNMGHALWEKKGLNAIVKSFGPCQPAQSGQADMGQNLLSAYQ